MDLLCKKMAGQRATNNSSRKIKDRLFSLIPKQPTVGPPRHTAASDDDDETSTVVISNIAKTVSPKTCFVCSSYKHEYKMLLFSEA